LSKSGAKPLTQFHMQMHYKLFGSRHQKSKHQFELYRVGGVKELPVQTLSFEVKE